MNPQLLEELLHEEESSSLDFKREQYRFDADDDEVRSEVLKDILAFANAWRRVDAYILVGVEEVKGGRSIIHGIANHIDDSNWQQFINSKTQRPIEFSYEAFSIEGKTIGIFRIPPQRRPLFCKKSFGKVKANEVYIRRGSSTAIADPDEIATMGDAVAENGMREPVLEMEFANVNLRKGLACNLSLECQFLVPMSAPKRQGGPVMMAAEMVDVFSDNNYREKLIKHVAAISPLKALGFRVHNRSEFPAIDVRVEVSVERREGLWILDENDYPSPPSRGLIDMSRSPLIHRPSPMISVATYGTQWSLVARFGKIQPQAVTWSDDVFYIASAKPLKLQVTASLFADNLHKPKIIPLQMDFIVSKRDMTPADLDSFN